MKNKDFDKTVEANAVQILSKILRLYFVLF
jgi:hypothetical protein